MVVMPRVSETLNISEEHIAPVFRVEKRSKKQPTSCSSEIPVSLRNFQIYNIDDNTIYKSQLCKPKIQHNRNFVFIGNRRFLVEYYPKCIYDSVAYDI
jgi:hypothetical protein